MNSLSVLKTLVFFDISLGKWQFRCKIYNPLIAQRGNFKKGEQQLSSDSL